MLNYRCIYAAVLSLCITVLSINSISAQTYTVRHLGSQLGHTAYFVEDLRMFVAAPPGFLDMLLGDHGSAGPMKPRAIDQPGLKSLQLLAGNDCMVSLPFQKTA